MGTDSSLYDVIEKLWKSREKYGKKFMALLGIAGPLFCVYLRSLWDVYNMGRLSVYGISASNLRVNLETVIGQILLLISVVLIIVFSNFICFAFIQTTVITAKLKKNRIVRTIITLWKYVKVVLFFGIEALVMIYILIISEGYEQKFGLNVFLDMSFWRAYIIMLILTFLLNSFAVLAFCMMMIERRNERKKETDKEHRIAKKIIECTLMTIIVAAVITAYFYVLGRNIELNRRGCSVIVGIDTVGETKDILSSVYPLVYEDSEYYYVSEFIQDGNKISIRGDYYKIVEKVGISVYKLDNIENLSNCLDE